MHIYTVDYKSGLSKKSKKIGSYVVKHTLIHIYFNSALR